MSEENRNNAEIKDYAALDNIPSGVGVYDVTGDHIEMKYLNNGYYQMIGTERDKRSQFFGLSVVSAIHPDDIIQILNEAHASMREKRMFGIRFRVLGGNGSYIWIGIRANHISLNSETERFFASYYNVDAYISRQVMLETSRAELDSILGSIPGGVALFSYGSDEIRIEYANNGFYEIHHGSKEYWLSRNPDPVEWLLPEDKINFWNELNKVNNGTQSLGNAEYRITGEDGKPHWVNNQFRFAYKKDDVLYYYASFTDLDELKAVEASRAEARKMYEAAVEDANLVVWEYDIQNHRIIMAENEFTKYDYRKFGLPKITENAPQSLLPYIDEASVDTFLEMYRKVDAGESHVSCEVWYKLNPGREPRCERILYTTVYDADGKPVKAYGIGQNITRLRLAQAEYDRLRAQLTGNLTGIVSSTQLNISKNIYISGYSPYSGVEESLKRRTADEHFAAAAASIEDENLKKEIRKNFVCSNLTILFRSGKHQIERTYPIKTSYGGIMWVHTALEMMQNPSTGDIEGISFSKDITEEKRTHEIISRLSSTSCDYIGVLDITENSFTMHTCNWECSAVAAGQKIPYDTAIKMLADDHIRPDKRKSFIESSHQDTLTAGLKEKEQVVLAYDYLDSPDSEALLKKQIIFSWLNEGKREILCVQQDVTEAYQKEQEQITALEKAKLDADRANEAKSVFLSGMSHDMRTPLNGVLGFTALAMKEDDLQKKQDYLGKIDTSGKLLRDLINDTLELSRIESGKFKLDMEVVMPDDLLPAVTTALKPSAELKNIHYTTNFTIDMTVPVWCDKLKFQKIALNLISNAIKYTPNGGAVSVSLKSEQVNELGSCYVLIVEDTGIGMSEEFIKRMYEPFAQEKRSESIKELGTGLGLSIVKRYVDLMGGKIEVASKLHQGTRIQVIIPISTENRDLKQIKAESTAVKTMVGKRILLCEDNYMNTEIAVMLLKDRGIVVETAENGKAGLEKFTTSEVGSFDAILMDIRMPVMDGYEAVKCIRELERPDAATIPIIAMTADAFEESIQEAKEAGMNAYVTKPIEPKILYQTLSQYIS